MKGTLRWLVLGFLIFFALWYINGGPEQENVDKNPFIKTANQDGLGETYSKPAIKKTLFK